MRTSLFTITFLAAPPALHTFSAHLPSPARGGRIDKCVPTTTSCALAFACPPALSPCYSLGIRQGRQTYLAYTCHCCTHCCWNISLRAFFVGQDWDWFIPLPLHTPSRGSGQGQGQAGTLTPTPFPTCPLPSVVWHFQAYSPCPFPSPTCLLFHFLGQA